MLLLRFTEKVVKYGDDQVMDFFIDLQVWGTPEQCYQKIVEIQGHTSNDSNVGIFSYAGMPPVDAEHNLRLFAVEVMPRLKKLRPVRERSETTTRMDRRPGRRPMTRH